MSIRSLAALAVARDRAAPGSVAAGGRGQIAVTGADDASAAGGPVPPAGPAPAGPAPAGAAPAGAGPAGAGPAGAPPAGPGPAGPPPGGPGAPAGPATPPAAAPAAAPVPQRFTDVLISAIPTEPLAAYTALVGIVAGAVDPAVPRAYLPFRWWAYAAFLTLTVVGVWVAYRRAAQGPLGLRDLVNLRAFPWAEGFAALVAAAAWGLAMPGSPLVIQLKGTARTLAEASIVIGAAALLSLVSAPQLRTGTRTPGEAAG